MKYRCNHCNHVFEPADKEFHHCPKCFWTTSIVPLDSERRRENTPQPASLSSAKRLALRPMGIAVVALALIIGLSYALFFAFSGNTTFWSKLSTKSGIIVSGTKHEPSAASKREAGGAFAEKKRSLLTVEDEKTLAIRFQLSIPRELGQDEEEVLKKQVSFPAQLAKPPTIAAWTKEDFKALINSEQRARKILLGWQYVRGLVKTFEKHYLAAVNFAGTGDYVLAHEEFLRALSFPVYQNDVELYRAVVLVMLRSYINDVIGKIGVLNQYLFYQRLSTGTQAIFQSYQELLSVLDLRDWDQALRLIEQLRGEITSFENEAGNASVEYPPAFANVDRDIQNAIRLAAVPRLDPVVNLKALRIDLDLKEEIVRQNTAQALQEVGKQYEQALRFLEETDWREAERLLHAIRYPPELVDDARRKIAVVEKVLQAEAGGTKSESTSLK